MPEKSCGPTRGVDGIIFSHILTMFKLHHHCCWLDPDFFTPKPPYHDWLYNPIKSHEIPMNLLLSRVLSPHPGTKLLQFKTFKSRLAATVPRHIDAHISEIREVLPNVFPVVQAHGQTMDPDGGC